MTDHLPQPKRRSLFMRFALRVTFLLVVYVLSIGPMYWKWEEAMMTGDNEALLVFYMPLMVASEICEPFRNAINSYIDFWVYS